MNTPVKLYREGALVADLTYNRVFQDALEHITIDILRRRMVMGYGDATPEQITQLADAARTSFEGTSFVPRVSITDTPLPTRLRGYGQELPDKPSQLIYMALGDLEKVENDDRYTVDMVKYHVAEDDTCYVCLAGAVMAKRLPTHPTVSISPSLFRKDIEDKLQALDEFRTHSINAGLGRMGLTKEKAPELYGRDDYPRNRLYNAIRVGTYKESPKRFKKNMRRLAKAFEKLGH